MDHSEALKSMLQDIINDRHDEATETLRGYIVAKTRDVAGLSVQEPDYTEDEE